ncbi:DUF4974 domain-containing protein [Chitinophaga agrisoli]|uniref:DUF4974 domain-containing protein n=1 Tax=Chitinophaga agrisoli TaxID=2607653 RepID=A0A5B2VHC1_9BACT|nr:FecR domain-containing protein [Chitinophaga agrisoli]KAA2238973.1 DUF4974 domain-containing protein [Chitinophaga agrisoli]
MNHTTEEIKSLMIEKLDNRINPEDEQLLQQLINEQADVQEMWTEMQALFIAGPGKELMERLDTRQEWQIFNATLRSERRRKLFTYGGLAAGAAAAAIAVLLYINISSPINKTTPPLVAVTQAPKGILLQIDNGKTIDLSAQGNTAITAGSASLHNNGKVLTLQGGNSTQWTRITVPTGMDYQVKLPDNSILWLNAATTAHFPMSFSGNTREIEIHGEAYLQVAKDENRPFIVHLPGADVQVLGTAFNINSYDSGVVKVALVEGSVNMRAGGETVGLKPGYQGHAANGLPIKVAPFDAQQVLSWMKGQYMFSNTPVHEIVQSLQRWYDVEVVLDNTTVGNKRFTGVINKQKKLQDFLDDLTETAEISYYFKDQVLHLR